MISVKSISWLVFLLCFSSPALAQPSRDRVLGDVEFREHPEEVEIQVHFNFPVRYLSHFPVEEGNELRIKLLPIAIAAVDRDALFHRESLTPEKPNLVGLDEVVYEGDTFSGLYVSLYFHGSAHWQVVQGADYRSLNVQILPPFPVVPAEGKSE